MYIVKQKQTKKFANIIEKCGGFLKFDDIQILLKANFFVVFWSFINLPWVHLKSHKKVGPDLFSRLTFFWIQTNRQGKFIYRLIFQYRFRIFSLNFFSFLDKVKGRVFTPQQAQPAPQYPSNQRGGTNPGKVGTVSSAFKTAHEQLIIDQNTKNQRGGREITQVTRRAEVYSSFY